MATPSSEKEEEETATVEKVAWRDALGRPGLFTGTTTLNDDNDTTHPKNGTMDYNEDSLIVQYVGEFSADHHWEGKNARIAYKTGDTYQGSVRASQKEGLGVLTWADGRSYSGSYVKDLRHGQGTYRWTDGSHYTGEFARNQREGYGSFTAGSVSYVGIWKQGVYHGQGTYRYVDEKTGEAVVYTGEFANGTPNGVGKETTRGGTIVRHDGAWKDGQPVRAKSLKQESLAVVVDQPWFDPSSHFPAVYRGLWSENRQPEGNGTAEYNKGPINEYEGCWKNGRYHGQGRIVYQTGDVYSGMMEDSKRQGQGTIQWKDGRQYTGDWVNNVRTGVGVFTWPTGDRYEGEFDQGQRSGAGMFVFGESGAYYSGEWKRGAYHGKGKMVDASGACYDGEFVGGQRHGVGEEFDHTGHLRRSGQWWNGEYQTDNPLLRQRSSDEPPPATNNDETHSNDEVSFRSSHIEADSIESSEDQHCSEDGGQHDDHDGEENVDKRPSLPAPPSSPPPPVPAQTLLRGWSAQRDPLPPRRAIAGEEKDCVAVVDKSVMDGLGCSGLYTGLVLKGKPHGVGRLVYDDGKRIHEGFWIHGSKEGHGRCLFSPQQDFHEGEYKGNLRHGPGRYSWMDGRLYVGGYKNDKRDGHGVFTYPNGERYEGSFKEGHRSGFGRFDFIEKVVDGRRVMAFYEGEWKEGDYNGNGRLVLSQWSYDGEWQGGKMHGEGVKSDAARSVLEQGVWVDGDFHTTRNNNTMSEVSEDEVSHAVVVD